MKKPNYIIDFEGELSDKRLEDRARKVVSALVISRTSSVHGSTLTEADQKGFYRFWIMKTLVRQSSSSLTKRCKECSRKDV
ncbi:MAG: hypothetical protein IPJ86_16705 [Bacteroidetes bacterium]|nr:hypothetical protein [Bacteroidota bacterium]